MTVYRLKVLLFGITGCLLASQIGAKNEEPDVVSFLTREKCIEELGCFNAGSPFFDIVERPLSLLPNDREDINTKFLLFTPSNPDAPFNFSNMGSSINDLYKSHFNPGAKTKFLVPGFISHTAPKWKDELKRALLLSEGSNVFQIDWSGGDGPLYEQAVANTRVVGAELALFIKRLQERTSITPQSVHIIGHSLGSHIAGYAGKRLQNLGRISALDPAGPYFTNVDPLVRLHRSDALFVDAIHTNAAATRFQGFGMTESIGHFDFYPNGGHVQPGCEDMGHAIWNFLKHPTFDAEGLHDIECSHVRAVNLFISSIVTTQCEHLGILCDNYENYTAGKCGFCDRYETCVPMGMHADSMVHHIQKDHSLAFYLNTTSTEPFC